MKQKEHIHFIGIGGIGMSSLARILLEKKMGVSGSDLKKNEQIEGLEKMGAACFEGHSASNIPDGTSSVVFSSQVTRDNPEVAEAESRGIPVLHRSDLLNELMKDYKSLLVAGSHGKTTTSGLLATVLEEAGLHPSFMVGGIVKSFGTNGALGSGEYFVSECDESDGTHLKYFPYGLIVTNIDHDHMDYFKTDERLVESFKALIYKTKKYEHLFYCGDDTRLHALELPGVSYGFSADSTLRITDCSQKGFSTYFDLYFKGKNYQQVEIGLLGRHNVLNATAVFGLALSLGISEESIRKGFLRFKGCKRRLDVIEAKREALFIDDYAHHPTEVKATLTAIREAYPERRLLVVFQPHRYSRTGALFEEFAASFSKADRIYITDVYGAGESPIEGVSGELLAKKTPRAQYLPKNDIVSELEAVIRPFDLVVFLGAGDISKIALMASKQEVKRFSIALLAGGISPEHDVSFMSAKNLISKINCDLYDVEAILFSKQGDAIWGEKALVILENESQFEGGSGGSISEAIAIIAKKEIVFPVLHGSFGEDGRLQGILDWLRIPYLGSGAEGSMIAMNKAVTKKLAEAKGVPVAPYVDLTRYEWESEPVHLLNHCNKLTYPLFVKPVHLGSSVGITKVEREEDLPDAVNKAFQFDDQIIVEEGIICREIEFAILGKGPYEIFTPGEILIGGKVFDYSAKYGKSAASSEVPAILTRKEISLGKEIALQAYRAALMDGMARVDLFLKPNGQFLLNEINPIPGCTPMSIFPRMCAHGGLEGSLLIDKLVRLALKRHRDLLAR